MRHISRQFRKMGKAIGRFFERVRKGSAIDIAILVCTVGLLVVTAGIVVFSVRGVPAASVPSSAALSADPASESVPASSSDAQTQTGSSESGDPNSDPLNSADYDGTVLPATQDGGQTYVDETLFLGDSNTYRLVAYGLTTWQNNLSAVGMGIQHVTNTPCIYFEGSGGASYLADAVKKMQPRRIIITYGTNNTDWSADTFIKQYKNALDTIRRKWEYADIIINAIPPVAAARTNAQAEQAAIDKFNKALADFAKEEGYTFLNSSEALRDGATGYGKTEYFISDGLHLSEAGAKALMNYVRTHTHIAPDGRPALTAIPTHIATPETMFNPQGTSSDSESDSASGFVTVKFYISEGADNGTLSGTLTQTVKQGQICEAVTLKLKEGCTAKWGCTEGSIEKGLTKQSDDTYVLRFTVPPTKLATIEVWVSISKAHTHTWGNWKDLGNGTHQGTCVAPNCPDSGALGPVEAHEWGVTNSEGIRACTKCGASEKDPAWTPSSSDPTPSESTPPVDPTPSESTPPVDPTPSNPTPPVDPTPSESTPPVDPTPSNPTPPVDPTPSEPAPVDPTPADPTPSNPTPSEPAPAEPTPEGGEAG